MAKHSMTTSSSKSLKRPAQISDNGLTEFTRFSELPTELRLKIWRCMFPRGRLMDLSAVLTVPKDYRFPTPPMTLSVNHESRTETLRRYWVLRQEHIDVRKSHPTFHQLHFNPQIDSLCIPDADFWYPAESYLLESLQVRAPGLVEAVRTIGLLNLLWNPAELHHVRSHARRAPSDPLFSTSHGRANLFELLSHFPGLRDLDVYPRGLYHRNVEQLPRIANLNHGTGSADDRIHGDRPGGGKQQFEEEFAQGLEVYGSKLPDRKVPFPTVTMRNWEGPRLAKPKPWKAFKMRLHDVQTRVIFFILAKLI